MSPEEICKSLESRFGGAITESLVQGGHPQACVSADAWPEVALFLRDDADSAFNLLRSITGVDLLEDNKLACIYDMQQIPMDRPTQLITTTHEFCVRIETDRDNPMIPSVASVWPTADWHEREVYDMFGVRFSGHPDLRRILCPDDWEGYPLRKDYEFPLEYHGIPAVTEMGQTRPIH